MSGIRIIQIIVGIAGLGALLLGLTFWILHINLINIHMLFGMLTALMLLILSILAISTRGIRWWGIAGVIYALLVPIFGLTQATILPGDLHWLIQIAHMLGAITLAGFMSNRYLAVKQGQSKVAARI